METSTIRLRSDRARTAQPCRAPLPSRVVRAARTACLVLCACAGLAVAAAPAPSLGGPWYTKAIGGDDAPFKQAAAELKKGTKDDKALQVELKKAEVRAKRYPDDALTVFRWACLAYWARARGRLPMAQDYLARVKKAMVAVEPPYPLQFARNLFCIEYDTHWTREIIPVGRKLLANNPDDVPILVRMAKLLAGLPGEDGMEGIRMAQRCADLQPNNSGYLFDVAFCRYIHYTGSGGGAENGEAVIAAFELFVKKAEGNPAIPQHLVGAAKSYIAVFQRKRDHGWK